MEGPGLQRIQTCRDRGGHAAVRGCGGLRRRGQRAPQRAPTCPAGAGGRPGAAAGPARSRERGAQDRTPQARWPERAKAPGRSRSRTLGRGEPRRGAEAAQPQSGPARSLPSPEEEEAPRQAGGQRGLQRRCRSPAVGRRLLRGISSPAAAVPPRLPSSSRPQTLRKEPAGALSRSVRSTCRRQRARQPRPARQDPPPPRLPAPPPPAPAACRGCLPAPRPPPAPPARGAAGRPGAAVTGAGAGASAAFTGGRVPLRLPEGRPRRAGGDRRRLVAPDPRLPAPRLPRALRHPRQPRGGSAQAGVVRVFTPGSRFLLSRSSRAGPGPF